MTSQPSLSGSTTTPPVLVIVEDDADIGATLLWAFQSETPYHAVLVTDAVQALEVAQSLSPSLFILDYQLPGMNGLELADRLRTVEGLKEVPTLMVSAYSPHWQAMQQRGITFLPKPFRLTDFLQAVDQLLPPLERGRRT